MGQTLAKEKLFHEIDCNQPDKVKFILVQYPEYVNEYFDEEKSCLPLTKAAWLGYLKVLDMLIILGADINKKVNNGFSAIFYACERGKLNILQRLLECDNLKIFDTDKNGFTPLDISIVNGYYNCALELIKKGAETKSLEFYQKRKDEFVDFEIDFEWFLENLNGKVERTDKEANKMLFRKKMEYEERVIDPNETWTDFFSSMVGFEDPKVVSLKELPKDFKPEDRTLHKLKSVINWRNQNYLEKYRSQAQSQTELTFNKEFKDIEMQKVQEENIN